MKARCSGKNIAEIEISVLSKASEPAKVTTFSAEESFVLLNLTCPHIAACLESH